ncbi:MAG TPA: NADH-quinone oxidoreductase subunit J [Thermoanaerobaculaceae bacterium]|nr:NADH-quinone oxidoreductase subunit J [Thermoanaerobaculaceae bacterium]
MTLLIGCLALLVISVVLLGVFRDLLYAAVALALASVILSIVLFHFGANVAGAFELSVCAGLITVLFVSTVSLTKDSDQKDEARLPALFILPAVALFAGVAYFLVRWLAPSLPAPTAAQTVPFREVFWGLRMTDVLGQISLVLVGVFGLLAILRARSAEGHHD